MADLDNIKTIVIVMMENRSFDHILGYTSNLPWQISYVHSAAKNNHIRYRPQLPSN